jgi:hypothetical protein
VTPEQIAELRERMERAAVRLEELAIDEIQDAQEVRRLEAKADGVWLAISYLDDAAEAVTS